MGKIRGGVLSFEKVHHLPAWDVVGALPSGGCDPEKD